jgi:alkylation response protein AidB-like acyl-CoA dehydrogenase
MFALTEEQQELQRAARAFVKERLPVSHLRALRDGKDPACLSREVWRDMARLGWAGIVVPEERGGAGLGMVEAGLVLEELGRTLAPTPMLATGVIAAGVLSGDALDAVVAGERIVGFAHDEGPRFEPAPAMASLAGEKVNVLDGSAADQLLVTTTGGLALVDRAAAGVTIEPLRRVDSRSAANVRFDGVRPGDLLDVPLGPLLDRATAALCAEMLGGIEEVFERTLAYLKERKQFGVPIGSFQALKHRAAHLHVEIELTRSVVRGALAALDAGAADASLLVSAAKARASDTFVLATAEAIQLHGGIGATDDLDIGLYYKRARVAEMLLGTAAYHRDRFARLQGY